jgi:hypothetical protein
MVGSRKHSIPAMITPSSIIVIFSLLPRLKGKSVCLMTEFHTPQWQELKAIVQGLRQANSFIALFIGLSGFAVGLASH